jgi:prepilin-type N-terminal cleavage/methylation domain-containing protein
MFFALNRRIPAPSFRKNALSDERGMTLIELMVATLVFSVISAATMVALGGALNLNRNDRNRSVAASLAAARMDELRSMDFDDIPIGQVSQTEPVDTVDYTVLTDTEWATIDADTNACDAPSSGDPRILRATVSVKWVNMSGVKPVKSQTTIAPPIGTYDPQTGHIAVKVVDRFGEGAGGHPVTVSRTGFNQTIHTTEEGCAFFAQLNPNTYNVSLSRPGYVDGQGVANPTRSMSVNVGFASAVTFLYDQAATLDLTLAGLDGYAVPTGIEALISNTGLQPAGKAVHASSGATALIQNLFPYPDGFQTWGGSCADADPAGENVTSGERYYPGADREPAILVEPGLTTTGTVVLKSVDLSVTGPTGDPIPNASVTAHHIVDSGSDLGCPSGKSFNLGTTDAQGQIKVAMPYGKWEFRVNGLTPSPVWPQEVMDPSATNPATVQLVVGL